MVVVAAPKARVLVMVVAPKARVLLVVVGLHVLLFWLLVVVGCPPCRQSLGGRWGNHFVEGEWEW